MTKADGSATATGGDLIATFTETSKEHQVVMVASTDGHIVGTKALYWYDIASQVHVAAASAIHWDLFNADSSLLVRVLSIRQRPDIVTAGPGVAFNWTFQRTTTVGTGGVAQTGVLADTSQTALSANITCRSKPTGGAGAGTSLRSFALHSEETNAGTIAIASVGGLELVPPIIIPPHYADLGILLRQNQGLSVTQTTNSAAGNTGWQIVFSVE